MSESDDAPSDRTSAPPEDDVEIPLIPKAPGVPSSRQAPVSGPVSGPTSAPSSEQTYSLRPSRLPPEVVEPTYAAGLPILQAAKSSSYSVPPPGVAPISKPAPSTPPPSKPPPPGAPPKAKRSADEVPPSSKQRRGRFGRVVAFLVSLVFAIVGFVPVFAAVLVRTPTVKSWAAKETSALLERELGTRAMYDVNVRLWPLTVTVENLVVEADDDKGPFLTVERASLRPRIFSLLAGKLNVGEVEVTGAYVRAVVRDGELVNFKPKAPKTSEKADSGETRTPFRSIAVTDARLDLDIDGTLIYLKEVDLDAVAEADGTFELGARAGAGAVSRIRPDPRHPGEEAADEDRLCHLEARARLDPESKTLLIRRLGLGAVVDFDPDVGTRPRCDLPEKDWRRVDLRLGAVEVPASALEGKDLGMISGRLAVTVPVALVHRFVPVLNTSGMVTLDLEAARNLGAPAPFVSGHLHTEYPGIDGRVFTDRADLDLQFDGRTVNASKIVARWADGDFTIRTAKVALSDPRITLDARGIVADKVEMQGLLRDLGVHPQSHVGWAIQHVEFEQFGGTLIPLNLEGKLVAHTEDFGVFNRPAHLKDRKPLVHEDRADIKGVLAIHPNEVAFEKMHVATPRSNLSATVKLGFLGEFGLDVSPGSVVDLDEVGPLSGVKIAGRTTLSARGSGPQASPRIEGDIRVDGFELGGIKAGDIKSSHVVFEPLHMEFTQLELVKNASVVSSPKTSVAFDSGASVLVDSEILTTTAPHLKLGDFFEVFHLDKDPRFKQVAGTAIGQASLHYVIGGPEDKCGGGLIDVKARMQIDRPELFGESFDKGAIDMRFRWDDSAAGAEGMEITVASASVEDAMGSVTAQAEIRHGGELRGTAVAAGIPLSKIESLGKLRDILDGDASAVASFGGTLSRPTAELDIAIGPLRFGANKMPSSRFAVKLEPDPVAPVTIGTTACGLPIFPAHDPAAPSTSTGQYRLDGQLFDGQVVLDGVTITDQMAVTGKIALVDLDVGTLLGGLPLDVIGAGQTPQAKLSANIDIARLDANNLGATEAAIDLRAIKLSRSGRTVKLVRADAPIRIKNGNLELPEVGLDLVDKSGLSIGFTAKGRINSLFAEEPKLDLSLAIAPFDLSTLRDDLPSVDRITGTLSGAVEIAGTFGAPKVTGYAKLREGSLAITDVPVPLDSIAVDVSLGDGELRITKATASVGAGTLDVTGRIPIVGFGFGSGTATITARGVKLPVGEDIDVVADADLDATIPATSRSDGALPELRGTASVTSFLYRRPIALSVDLGEVSRNIGRDDIQAYDPARDFLRFNLRVISPHPLVVRNDLADVRLEIVEPGIELSGTNQRYGAKGALRLLSESKIRLRNHEFDVREGYVRFNDPTKVKAEIDVRATTDMRRYASSADPTATDATASGGATTAGQWDVSIHAHGSTEDLKLDLSSDPPMDQEDIVLLLTVGMTRAEIDRGLATSLGETVAFEALSALTGADKAVKNVVPIIDYFHFGTSYSSRTGRTEPNVTVGKRLNDDVRASVTTTLTERDVAATVEWRLKKGVSIQGSYDNTNDAGTIIGNLGADLRWRLEFE